MGGKRIAEQVRRDWKRHGKNFVFGALIGSMGEHQGFGRILGHCTASGVFMVAAQAITARFFDGKRVE